MDAEKEEFDAGRVIDLFEFLVNISQYSPMKNPLFFGIISLLLSFSATAENMPALPNFKELLKNDLQLLSDIGKERALIFFATDDDIEAFKKKLAPILGKEWVELPAPEISRSLRPGAKDLFPDDKNRPQPKILGTALYATGKKVQWHIQVMMKDIPARKKKHTVEISVYRMRLETN